MYVTGFEMLIGVLVLLALILAYRYWLVLYRSLIKLAYLNVRVKEGTRLWILPCLDEGASID
jgi:hypothetical protein